MKILPKMIKKMVSFFLKIAILLVGRELLRRKRMEAQVRHLARQEAQSRMNEFLSIASHDLKTPLTSIKGNIQLMTRRLRYNIGLGATGSVQSEELVQTLVEARDLLERTDSQLTRLTRIVNTLLESARSTACMVDLLLEVGELDEVLRETIQERKHIPEARTIHLSVPEGKSVLVLADMSRIKQVIVHYLSNAHKYSPLEQPIEVRLQENGRTASVFVRDKGPGVPVEEYEHIWDQFYRVPGIAVRNGTEVGLGLGLHISRKIIEQHRGQVGVYSTPDDGSTFWFTLPLAKREMQLL